MRGRVLYCFRSPCEGYQTVSTSDSAKGCSPPQCGGECADSAGLPLNGQRSPECEDWCVMYFLLAPLCRMWRRPRPHPPPSMEGRGGCE